MNDEKNLEVEVKNLLDKFQKDLAQIELENNYENICDVCFREDLAPVDYIKDVDSIFRNNFLKNAKRSNEDFILSEIGEWEK